MAALPLLTVLPLVAPLALPSQTPAAPAAPQAQAALLVRARPQDTAQAVAQRYGVDPSVVTRDGAGSLAGPLPAGEVLRVQLSAPARRQAPGIRRVALRSGDTLSAVARRYALSETELISANLDLPSLDRLEAGRTLNIPTQVRGLLLTIKPGQSAAELIALYRADPLWTARVNHFTLPTELNVGDELLLPGIFATARRQELLLGRERERQNALAARREAQYQAFLAWQAQRQREREAQYRRYQAWLVSPQRLAEVAKYQRQADYEAWQAHLERLAERQAREEAARQAAEQRAREQLLAAQEQAQQSRAAELANITALDPRPQMQLAAAAERSAPPLTLTWPLEHPRLTSRFGEEDIALHRAQFHSGQDMAAPEGTPIYAAADGVVTQSGEGAYGLNVYVQRGSAVMIYGHRSSVAVEAGQEGKAGDLLGQVGCTGECTGPHLHFELRLGGVPVDPLVFLPPRPDLAVFDAQQR